MPAACPVRGHNERHMFPVNLSHPLQCPFTPWEVSRHSLSAKSSHSPVQQATLLRHWLVCVVSVVTGGWWSITASKRPHNTSHHNTACITPHPTPHTHPRSPHHHWMGVGSVTTCSLCDVWGHRKWFHLKWLHPITKELLAKTDLANNSLFTGPNQTKVNKLGSH